MTLLHRIAQGELTLQNAAFACNVMVPIEAIHAAAILEINKVRLRCLGAEIGLDNAHSSNYLTAFMRAAVAPSHTHTLL